jgi:hypothetical protein
MKTNVLMTTVASALPSTGDWYRQKRAGSTWSTKEAGHGFGTSFGVDGSASAGILTGEDRVAGGKREGRAKQ